MSEQLTKSQIGTITGVSAFTSVLSLVGSIFIIGCYLKLKSLRKLSFSLVFLLSCTDVFNQVFDLISPSDADLEAMELNPDLVTSTCLAQGQLLPTHPLDSDAASVLTAGCIFCWS